MRLILGFLSCFAFAAASASPLPQAPHIYVEGSAEVEVIPDQMTISVGLSAEHQDVAQAKADVDKRSRTLLQTLKAQKIAAADIGTTALQINPVYDFVDGRQVPRGTRVYREVEITLRNLERYGQLMEALMTAQVANTVNTRLTVADDQAVSDRALIQALNDAQARAQAMLQSIGAKLGGVHSISEFDLRRDESYQLVPNRDVFEAKAGNVAAFDRGRASEPFEPGIIRATAKVYVVYLIAGS